MKRIALNDSPVVRDVSDAAANVPSTNYINSQVAINPSPVPRLGPEGASVVISWPASSDAFVLQSADTLSPASWDVVAMDVVTNRSMAAVTGAAANAHRHFRLQGN